MWLRPIYRTQSKENLRTVCISAKRALVRFGRQLRRQNEKPILWRADGVSHRKAPPVDHISADALITCPPNGVIAGSTFSNTNPSSGKRNRNNKLKLGDVYGSPNHSISPECFTTQYVFKASISLGTCSIAYYS